MKLQRTDREVAFARVQGKAVYELRMKKGISRRRLADFTGINYSMIFRIEMGEATASAFDLDAIAGALDASRENLFPRTAEVITLPTMTFPNLRRAYA
jgi:transcriptional regulator with XRE-family HTH domain